jgi:hypothetical protein
VDSGDGRGTRPPFSRIKPRGTQKPWLVPASSAQPTRRRLAGAKRTNGVPRTVPPHHSPSVPSHRITVTSRTRAEPARRLQQQQAAGQQPADRTHARRWQQPVVAVVAHYSSSCMPGSYLVGLTMWVCPLIRRRGGHILRLLLAPDPLNDQDRAEKRLQITAIA